jgi:DNA polymerase sigma
LGSGAKTRLLRAYVALDERLAVLVAVIKTWAKAVLLFDYHGNLLFINLMVRCCGDITVNQ